MEPKSAYWLPEAEWRKIQQTLPIVCVDVLAFKRADRQIAEVGLIKRHTPHQGPRWCLIGGRLQYSELLTAAVNREIHSALGDAVEYALFGDGQPLLAVQYLPVADKGDAHDPRQHAIGLTFGVELSGVPRPQAEALDFGWFAVSEIPAAEFIGFGQNRIILDCLHKLASQA